MGFKINNDYYVSSDGETGKQFTNPKRDYMSRVRSLDDIDMIIVHCNAVKGLAWETPEPEIRYATNPNHINKKLGCPTASYHYYINKSGDCWQLVSKKIMTDHCSGQNRNAVAICITHDGYNSADITPELMDSLVDCLCQIGNDLDWDFSDEWNVRDRVRFHREFANKACPGRLDQDDLWARVVKRFPEYIPVE